MQKLYLEMLYNNIMWGHKGHWSPTDTFHRLVTNMPSQVIVAPSETHLKDTTEHQF